MPTVVIILTLLLSSLHAPYAVDQVPDFLILNNDTVLLKSYPLEQLNFEVKPYDYSPMPYPSIYCQRGYQATWRIVNNKLFLSRLGNVKDPQASIDLEAYFRTNEYQPIVHDGMVFADWYTVDFKPYPRKIRKCVYFFKTYKKVKKERSVLRIEQGIVKVNRY